MKQEEIDAHNRYQRHYYETQCKPTMAPRSVSAYLGRQIDHMVELAGLSKNQQILEVGAGLGRYSIPLLQRSFHLTCLDISPVMLDQLKASAGDMSVETVVADVADVEQVLAGPFDRVIGFFTLHHMHDLDLIFGPIARVTAPGGIVAFCEPVAFNPLYYIQIAVTPHMTWQGDKGIVNMRSSKVLPAMARAGLVDLRSVGFGFFPPFITNTRFGQRLEDMLESARIFGWLHAFQIFLGKKPLD